MRRGSGTPPGPLAGYYHWNDRQCLEQAVLIARANRVDVDEAARWSRAEGMIARYREIEERLNRFQ
ncbi:MAG: hypothetical protein ABIH26_04330 [Candidatus Eisenbacteria bacterium]